MKKLFFIVALVAFFATTQAKDSTKTKEYKVEYSYNDSTKTFDSTSTFKPGDEIAMTFKKGEAMKKTGKVITKNGKKEYQFEAKGGKFWMREGYKIDTLADGSFNIHGPAGDTTGIPLKGSMPWIPITGGIMLVLGIGVIIIIWRPFKIC